MGLPAQIQRQIDEAEALQASLAAQSQVVEPAAAPAANEPIAQAPAPAPEATAPDTPAAHEGKDEFQLLEQRYKSLQGMWQSAESRLRHSQAQVAELTERFDEMSRKLEKSQAPEASSPLVTDKDTEAFGSDLIDLARRISREEFGREREQLHTQISRLEQQLTAASQQVGDVVNTQVANAQERFYATLDSALPNWEALQATAEGQQWLATRIPGTAATWNDSLQDAGRKFDANRALEVFEALLASQPQLSERKKKAPSPSSNPELQRQVAPSKASSASQAPDSKKLYTARDYQGAMEQVVRFNKERRYDDAAALENELGVALAEGRVTP